VVAGRTRWPAPAQLRARSAPQRHAHTAAGQVRSRVQRGLLWIKLRFRGDYTGSYPIAASPKL
jgi:hypothetical protein